MKKIATIASVAALAVASASASAWWGAPYGSYSMSEDQRQAMLKQQTKAMEQMMAAHRQMAQHQAQMVKQMQNRGIDPMIMGFPGAMGPWSDMGVPEFPATPDMPAFSQAPDFPTMPEIPAFGQVPDFPTMPEIPAFGQMSEYPTIPERPGPFAMDMPQPPLPAHWQSRYAAMEAQRVKVMKESKARHEKAMAEMSERRKEIEANRFAHPHRYVRPIMPAYTKLAKTSTIPAPEPQATPSVESPAPVIEATPTPAIETAPAPATTTPASEAVPTAPAQAIVMPQS